MHSFTIPRLFLRPVKDLVYPCSQCGCAVVGRRTIVRQGDNKSTFLFHKHYTLHAVPMSGDEGQTGPSAAGRQGLHS